MLAQAILKLETERKDCKVESLEYCIAQALINLCQADPVVAEIIANSDKTIADCSKKMWEYAFENKQKNIFGALPQTIEKLIRDFYELDSINTNKSQQQSEPDTGIVIDIMGLLAD